VVPRGIVQSMNLLSLITKSEKVIVKQAPISPIGSNTFNNSQKCELGLGRRVEAKEMVVEKVPPKRPGVPW